MKLGLLQDSGYTAVEGVESKCILFRGPDKGLHDECGVGGGVCRKVQQKERILDTNAQTKYVGSAVPSTGHDPIPDDHTTKTQLRECEDWQP